MVVIYIYSHIKCLHVQVKLKVLNHTCFNVCYNFMYITLVHLHVDTALNTLRYVYVCVVLSV